MRVVQKFLIDQIINISNNIAEIIRITARLDAHKMDMVLNKIEQEFEKSLYPKNPTEQQKTLAKQFTLEYLNEFSKKLFKMDWENFKHNSIEILRNFNTQKNK